MYDITYDIMNKVRLSRLRRKLQSLRGRPANIRTRELTSLASSLGRRRHSRGKEPTFVSDAFPGARPISIPSHPRALNRLTATNILDQLEEDIFRWEELLGREHESPINGEGGQETEDDHAL
jgi:hypothetical protein